MDREQQIGERVTGDPAPVNESDAFVYRPRADHRVARIDQAASDVLRNRERSRGLSQPRRPHRPHVGAAVAGGLSRFLHREEA